MRERVYVVPQKYLLTHFIVREILPELINQIVDLISSEEFEQQETASRTIGEMCRKFGEKILNEILPILKVKSTSPDSRTREGVNSTLSEIMYVPSFYCERTTN